MVQICEIAHNGSFFGNSAWTWPLGAVIEGRSPTNVTIEGLKLWKAVCRWQWRTPHTYRQKSPTPTGHSTPGRQSWFGYNVSGRGADSRHVLLGVTASPNTPPTGGCLHYHTQLRCRPQAVLSWSRSLPYIRPPLPSFTYLPGMSIYSNAWGYHLRCMWYIYTYIFIYIYIYTYIN